MKPQLATFADVSSWLEIVREVEALCVRSTSADGATQVAGGMLLGGSRDHGWIRWLAVRSSARGAGVGQLLVEEGVKRMSTPKTISLDTFREEKVPGWPARRLYARMGFIAGPLVGTEGTPRQRFDLRRD